ncbi:MAG: hypothetical protein R3F43_18120 [bacterium]
MSVQASERPGYSPARRPPLLGDDGVVPDEGPGGREVGPSGIALAAHPQGLPLVEVVQGE